MGDTQRKPTILVVDDEELVRNVSKLMLERLGYQVSVAADGVEAVDLFRKTPDAIDLVLLDMTMPRMGGLETFHALRALRPDIRVVLASGYNEQDAAERFRGEGLAGFLQKPFQLPTLREKVGAALAG